MNRIVSSFYITHNHKGDNLVIVHVLYPVADPLKKMMTLVFHFLIDLITLYIYL